MARKGARAAAMQLVYEDLLGGGDDAQSTLRDLIAFTPEEDDQTYIDDVLAGVRGHAEELDARIAAQSATREFSRIARVVVSILRVALYEMLYRDDVPKSVTINEAVTLGNRFAEPGDARFINGVLGNIARGMDDQVQP